MACRQVLQMLLVVNLIGLQLSAPVTNIPTVPKGPKEPKMTNENPNGGEIAGMVVSAVVILAIIAAVIFYLYRKPKKSAGPPPQDEEMAKGAEADDTGETNVGETTPADVENVAEGAKAAELEISAIPPLVAVQKSEEGEAAGEEGDQAGNDDTDGSVTDL